MLNSDRVIHTGVFVRLGYHRYSPCVNQVDSKLSHVQFNILFFKFLLYYIFDEAQFSARKKTAQKTVF